MIKFSLVLILLFRSINILSMENNASISLTKALYNKDLKQCKELLSKITLSKIDKEYYIRQLSIHSKSIYKALRFFKKTHQISKKINKLALFFVVLYSPLFLLECYNHPKFDTISTIKLIFYAACLITGISLPMKLLCSMLYERQILSQNKTKEILNLIKEVGQK